MRPLVAALAGLAAVSLAAAQTDADPRAAQLVTILRLTGSSKTAGEACIQLRTFAAISPQHDRIWATASLNYASLLTESTCPNLTSPMELAISVYEEVIAAATSPEDAALARNNEALLVLAQNPARAVELLEPIFKDARPLNDADRAVYRLNLGAAYEAVKNYPKALEAYRNAVTDSADPTDAASSLAGALYRLIQSGAPGTWTNQLVEAARLVTARGGVRAGLAFTKQLAGLFAKSTDPPVQEMHAALLISAAGGPFDDASFRDAAVALAALPGAADLAAETGKLLTPLPTVKTTAAAETVFPRLAGRTDAKGASLPLTRAPLGRCLARIGDAYLNQRKNESALPAFVLSWLLDSNNTLAARQTAFLFHDYPALSDPALRALLVQTYDQCLRSGGLERLLGGGGRTGFADALIRRPENNGCTVPPGEIQNIFEVYAFLGLDESGTLAELETILGARRAPLTAVPVPALFETLAKKSLDAKKDKKAADYYMQAKRDYEVLGQLDQAVQAMRHAIEARPDLAKATEMGIVSPGQLGLAGHVGSGTKGTVDGVKLKVMGEKAAVVEEAAARPDREGYFQLPLQQATKPGQSVVFTLTVNGKDFPHAFALPAAEIPVKTALFEPAEGDRDLEGTAEEGIGNLRIAVSFDQANCQSPAARNRILVDIAHGPVVADVRSYRIPLHHSLVNGEVLEFWRADTGAPASLLGTYTVGANSGVVPHWRTYVYMGADWNSRYTPSFGLQIERAIKRPKLGFPNYLCPPVTSHKRVYGVLAYGDILFGASAATTRESGALTHGNAFAGEFGVFAPWVVSQYTRERRHAYFVAPIAVTGVQRMTSSNLVNDRQAYMAAGARFGGFKIDSIGPTPFLQIETLWGHWDQFEQPAPDRGRTHYRQEIRFSFEVPKTPFYTQVRENFGRGAPSLHVFLGYRFDNHAIRYQGNFQRLRRVVPLKPPQANDMPADAAATAPRSKR